jgi:hypothetical protein
VKPIGALHAGDCADTLLPLLRRRSTWKKGSLLRSRLPVTQSTTTTVRNKYDTDLHLTRMLHLTLVLYAAHISINACLKHACHADALLTTCCVLCRFPAVKEKYDQTLSRITEQRYNATTRPPSLPPPQTITITVAAQVLTAEHIRVRPYLSHTHCS